MKKPVIIFAVLLITTALFLLFSNYNILPAKIYKIAVLNYTPAGDLALSGMIEGLKEYDYVKGENLDITYSGYIKDKNKLQVEAKRLVSLKPDLIYTISTPATIAVQKAAEGTDIPIVFGPVSNPMEAGIVENMSNHGKNITGVSFGPQEPLRLEMLIKLNSSIKNILVPYTQNDRSALAGIGIIEPIAQSLGLNLMPLPVLNATEILDKLNGVSEKFDAIFITTDAMMVSFSDKVAKFAIDRQVPFTCPHKEGVVSGALFSYGFSVKDLGKQASRLVHMVLTGTSPNEIPIELSDFMLTINLDTAEKIGFSIPDYLLVNSFIVGR